MTQQEDRHHMEIFKVFTRQQPAMDYYDSLVHDPSFPIDGLKIFSFESVDKGQRKFLISSWSRFLDDYLASSGNHGHYYEIIRENCPCRIYFDIEYSIEDNPTVNGDKLTSKWIQLAVWKLHELTGLCVGAENVFVLDSSTEKKFSKHVIISIGHDEDGCELLLKSNAEVDVLVRHILSDIMTEARVSSSNITSENCGGVIQTEPTSLSPSAGHVDSVEQTLENKLQVNSFGSTPSVAIRVPHDRYADLWVQKAGSPKPVIIVDCGVYSRNRAFRLFGSTKYGKTAALKLLNTDKAKYARLKASGRDVPRRIMYAEALSRSFVVPLQTRSFLSDESISDSSKVEYTANETNHDSGDTNIGIDRPQTIALSKMLWTPLRQQQMRSDHEFIENPSNVHPITLPLVSLKSFGGISLLSGSLTSSGHLPHPPSSSWTAESANSSSGLGMRHMVILEGKNPSISSPFPRIDDFINSCELVTADGHIGHWSGWTIMFVPVVVSSSQLNGRSVDDFNNDLLSMLRSTPPNLWSKSLPLGTIGQLRIRYNITNNKFCWRIGRQHKSNGILVEVDLSRNYVYQRCWDPDCRGYKSPAMVLQQSAIPNG